ncbi:hypothetical protein U1Q18_009494, partial [Sarracenia purpurea var. burkii]
LHSGVAVWCGRRGFARALLEFNLGASKTVVKEKGSFLEVAMVSTLSEGKVE